MLFEIPKQLISLKSSNIYSTTAQNFAEFYNLYKQFPLPNDTLFPWLHGVDGHSNQQNLFFGVRRSLVPNYRGLMLVHCHEFEFSSRLIDSVIPEQLVNFTPPHQNEFIDCYNCDISINLRNFQNQIARFATISDLVLYGSRANEVAKILSEAQQSFQLKRAQQIERVSNSAGKRATEDANRLTYNIIVIEDDFTVFERNYPELVMYDSNGLILHKRNFLELETIQMREMTKATEITKNVWMGNTSNVPTSSHDAESIASLDYEDFSICIEAHESADMPQPSTLTLARETLNDLNDGQVPPEVIHFDTFATNVPNEQCEFDKFYMRLIQLLRFIQDQASHDRKILMHCSDGYTETSLVGLCWIMFQLKLSLPEAYLYLQQRRSFFVYAVDIPTLRKIEQRMLHESLEPEPKRKKNMTDTIQTLDIRQSNDYFMEDSDEDSEMERMGSHKSGDNRILLDDNLINQISNTNMQNSIYKQLHLSPTKEEESRHPWFFSSRFEGSFPSRILDFLYLGNLNHATNPEMLKALNITHIVSVGEKADLNSQEFRLLYLDNLYDDGIDSVLSRLDSTMEFVEDARKNGSQCLIHCRVGVSRSAAITICYVMKYLKCTLVEAYLFVRARRLNVIIQPNLKFMYEMLQLEQQQHGTLSISWPVLCNEVYNLNFTYRDM